MYKLGELIEIFYPNLSAQDKLDLGLTLESKAVSYDIDAWLEIIPEQLETQEVKLNLLYTYHELQYNYDGVANEIVSALVRWSDGALYFNKLDAGNNVFYQRLFIFYAVQNFEYLDIYKQMFVLSTRFALLAVAWGLPLKDNVSRFFARYCDITVLKTDSDLLAGALEQNSTPVPSGDSAKSGSKTVSQWLEAYRLFKPKNKAHKHSEFVAAKFDEKADKELKRQIAEITLLYELLISGRIWKDIKTPLCLHKAPEKINNKIDAEEFYLHRIQQTSDLNGWLKEADEVGQWLATKSDHFVKEIFVALSKKTDLLTADTSVSEILQIVDILAGKGHKWAEKVFEYHESDGKFHWNEKVLT